MGSLLGVQQYVSAATVTVQRGTTAERTWRPENRVWLHHNYDLLPFSHYFWEGVVDPSLEFRLLDDARQVYAGPNEYVRRMEGPDSRTIELRAEPVPGEPPQWREYLPKLDVAPGERLYLRFDFNPAWKPVGWLLIESQNGYREFTLPSSALGLPFGFGIDPGRVHVITLWNSGNETEHYQFRGVMQEGTDVRKGEAIAKVVISKWKASQSLLTVQSFDPLTINLTDAKSGWLETIRVFLPGYWATVDGQRVPVTRSPTNVAMLPIVAGSHTVVLRYSATLRVRLAALVSILTWLGCFAQAFSGRLKKGIAGAGAC